MAGGGLGVSGIGLELLELLRGPRVPHCPPHCTFPLSYDIMQVNQPGPEFGTWSKKVPILPPSPKFLILPSDAAEKRRHIAISHCCALFRHTQCIMCIYACFLHFHENND